MKKGKSLPPFLSYDDAPGVKTSRITKEQFEVLTAGTLSPVHLVKACISSQILLFVFDNHALNHVICAVLISGILVVIVMVTQSERKFLRSQEIKILISIYRHIFCFREIY